MRVSDLREAYFDPGLLAQTANGLQLPIGIDSPLVQHYQTRLTDEPVRQHPIVRGATVGDVVIWDNLAVMHRAPDYADLHEMMAVATCGYPFGDFLWNQVGSVTSSFTKGAMSAIQK